MQWQHKFEVPFEEYEQFTLALHYLFKRGQKAEITSLLMRHLLLHVLSQVLNCSNIIIDLVEFRSDQKHGHLMQNDSCCVHEFGFKSFGAHFLAGGQVVLIDHFYRDVDGLPCLSELDAHLVDSVNNALASLSQPVIMVRNKILAAGAKLLYALT